LLSENSPRNSEVRQREQRSPVGVEVCGFEKNQAEPQSQWVGITMHDMFAL